MYNKITYDIPDNFMQIQQKTSQLLILNKRYSRCGNKMWGKSCRFKNYIYFCNRKYRAVFHGPFV